MVHFRKVLNTWPLGFGNDLLLFINKQGHQKNQKIGIAKLTGQVRCLRGRYCKVLTDVDTETMKLKLKTLTGDVHEVDVDDANATVKDVKVTFFLELFSEIIRI